MALGRLLEGFITILIGVNLIPSVWGSEAKFFKSKSWYDKQTKLILI